MKKKIILLFCVMLCCMSISGCASSSKDQYEAKTASNLEEGYYIKDGDKFYPLVSDGKTYSGKLSNLSSKGQKEVVWISQNRDKIPVLNASTELVVKSDTILPSNSLLQYMEDYGVTIGLTFSKTLEPNVYELINDSMRAVCKGSNAEALLKKFTNDTKNLRFLDVGGVKISQEMLSDINTITGLVENNEYIVTFYEGSHYHQAKIIADTRVFGSEPDIRYPVASYNYSKDGYVSLVLPSNMASGYYYLDDAGIFYYDKQ